jgi:hypothetical protein
MRRFMTALAIGSVLLGAPWAAGAKTPGPVCRAACQPRIDEQCAGAVGRAKRRCRKPLLRACRAASPDAACETTADLTRALADRRLRSDVTALDDVALCGSGAFALQDASPGGAWEVRIAGGALVLALDGDTAATVAHDASGALLVDGRLATTTDAGDRCAADDDSPSDATVPTTTTTTTTLPPLPPDDDEDDARVIDAVRAVTDRALVIPAPDGDATQEQTLILCGAGVAVDTVAPIGNPAAGTFTRATWTVEASGASLILVLTTDGGGTPTFGLEFRADGAILIDGAVVQQRDSRQECDDATLLGRLTDALENQAFFFTVPVGNLVIRHKLGLCDSRRFRLDTTSTQIGDWRVFVSNGVANLILDPDGAGQVRAFPLAFDDDGTVTVQNTTPIDEPGLVEGACQS